MPPSSGNLAQYEILRAKVCDISVCNGQQEEVEIALNFFSGSNNCSQKFSEKK